MLQVRQMNLCVHFFKRSQRTINYSSQQAIILDFDERNKKGKSTSLVFMIFQLRNEAKIFQITQKN